MIQRCWELHRIFTIRNIVIVHSEHTMQMFPYVRALSRRKSHFGFHNRRVVRGSFRRLTSLARTLPGAILTVSCVARKKEANSLKRSNKADLQEAEMRFNDPLTV